MITSEGSKVARRSDGTLIGAAGVGSLAAAFLRWYAAGARDRAPFMGESDQYCVEAIVIKPNGTILRYDRLGWYEVTGKIAIGRGAELALGAMDAGAGAVTAVQLATMRLGGDPRAIDALILRRPKQAAA